MEGRFFLVLLVLGIVYCKREEVIFDSVRESKLGWDTYKKTSNNGWREASYDGGNGLISVYTVCDTERQDSENWVTSPMFSTNGSDTLWFKLKYNLRECPTKDEQVCEFNIYSYETNTAVPIPLYNPWDHVKTINISKVSSGSIAEISEIVIPISVRVKGNKIAIGFKDQGSCSKIISVKAYVIFCEATAMGLMTFNETSTMAVKREVKGQCISNAEVISEPQSVCNPNGDWEDTKGECECADGFEEKKDAKCIAVTSASASVIGNVIAVSIAAGLILLTRPYL